MPPSLGNIYKELAQDVGAKVPKHGCLEKVSVAWLRACSASLCACFSVRCSLLLYFWRLLFDGVVFSAVLHVG